MFELSTGGIKWYKPSDAPSALKKATYGSYKESWRCSNININKPLSSISYATVIGVLTEGPISGVIAFSSTAFYELVTYAPASKNLSFIDYTAKAKSNARYYKGRRYTYAKKGFAGNKTATYTYGMMM